MSFSLPWSIPLQHRTSLSLLTPLSKLCQAPEASGEDQWGVVVGWVQSFCVRSGRELLETDGNNGRVALCVYLILLNLTLAHG